MYIDITDTSLQELLLKIFRDMKFSSIEENLVDA